MATIDTWNLLINQTGTITSGVWNGTPIGVSYGGTGATSVAGAQQGLAVQKVAWRSVSSGTDTLTIADGTVEYSTSCTVTLPAGSTGIAGDTIRLVASAANVTLTIQRAGSDTIDGGTSITVALGTSRAACLVVRQTTTTAWGSVQPSGTIESFEFRLTGGSWFAYPQAWIGGTWVDVGAGIAATVESGSGTSWSATGTTLTLLSGLTNTTQPHAAQGKVYWTVSDLAAIWSSAIGSVYTIGQDTVSAMSAAATDNGRIGIAMTSAAGTFDASSENLVCVRTGQNGTDSHFIVTVVAGTGTFGSPLLDSVTTITGARATVMHRQALSFAQAQGASNAAAAQSPPTATATRLYLFFTSANTLVSNITLADPRFRLTRLSGSP